MVSESCFEVRESPALGKLGVLGDDCTDENAEKYIDIIVITLINIVSENNRKTTTNFPVYLFLVIMVT